MPDHTDQHQRDILPIPDRTFVGLTTYDAKDPATKFPPIVPLRPPAGASGVIIAQGGSVGGWSLYAKDGKLKYCYNFFGIKLFHTEATQPIPAGKHQVRMEFKYDGGGWARAVPSRSSLTASKSAGVLGRRDLRRR